MERIPVRHLGIAQKSPNISENFIIRDISNLLARHDMVQGLHRHDFFYILALQNGAGSHEIDFAPYAVSSNSVFFIRPGQVHQLVLKAGSAGYLMQFNNEFYFTQDKVSNQLLRKAGNINHYKPDADRFQKLLVILTYIFQEYTDKQENYQEVIKANMGIFFIELVRQSALTSSNNQHIYVLEKLENFQHLLEKNISAHKQVSEYADMLNLSVYQLNAITKTTLGKTCSELINEHILLIAKRYLLATSNLINQIAYQLGYEDVSYFIRFFKKHTGHSPEAFRHNFR